MTQATPNTTATIPQPGPSIPSAQPAPAPHSAGLLAGIKRVFAFLGWVLSGFGLIHLFSGRKTAGGTKAEEIVVYTVHQSFYLWAIILVGFVAAACVNHWPATAIAWGWV